MPVASREEIESFLADVRKTIRSSFNMRGSEKYRNTLTKLGFNRKDVKREIETLSVENYAVGPVPEHHTSNSIWIFGKIIQNHEIYIKLKLIGMDNDANEVDTVHCMSFHFAEENLSYPYKNT